MCARVKIDHLISPSNSLQAMKIKTLLFILLAAPGIASAAAPELKALSGMLGIQAEAYRLTRLGREISIGNPAPEQTYAIKAEIKASTEEMIFSLRESKAGLTKLKMQAQYQQLDGATSDFVAESLSSGGNKPLEPLLNKQAGLLKLADQLQLAIAQNTVNTSVGALSLIGKTRVNLEKTTHDYEFCTQNCAQILPANFAALSKNIDAMRENLPDKFSKAKYDMAKTQLISLKQALDARIKTEPSLLAQSNAVLTAGRILIIVNEVLDSYTD
jgi:hypothetical protein